MDTDRYEAAGRLFHAALELPPDRRAAFVHEACGADEGLRLEVESLLAARERAGRFIEVPAMEIAAALIAADEAANTPPARIGRYEVGALIARGGMGDVYAAFDPMLGRRVALKLPRRALTTVIPALDRFEREARAASSLNHPNIVTIYEIGEAAEGHYISMELVDGHSLAAMIGQPMPAGPLARVGRQLAEALAVAHAAGIVHGDIKPENVMVRSDGYVKVLDFGLARLLSSPPSAQGSADPTMARASGAFGTPRYMAPEQTRGEAASAASDVFALGLVLYELATSRHALPSAAEADRRPPLDGLAIPAPLERLVLRMLAVDPAARPTARDVEAELASLDAAAVARPDGTRSLPPQRTPFVGRTSELAALESMLRDPATRLITLTGTAGTGKTRLALQLAAQAAPRFDAVSFVNLAPISDPALVAAAVAQAQGVREVVGRPLVEVLCDYLRERGRVLVVIDNFEQVAPAASLVRDLLDACPDLTILVTSRLVLHIYGEHEFAVPPLPVPEGHDTLERLMAYPSVELFVQRAAAVNPQFSLTERNVAPVVEICRRLDGLPLAIELAAARAKILPPAELLARLERRLDLLGEAVHDRPARQQTLRQAIDWSYYLLTPPEQTLFRRLSVFVGGCTLEAMEAVCNATEDLQMDVLRGVITLVDNSLLIPRTSGDDQSRFFMLETVREYARERLDDSGEAPAVRRAHAAYALVVAEEETPDMGRADREAWLQWCDREHDNLRAAIHYLVAVGDAEWGLRLGAALFRFWEEREFLTEGRQALAAVLAIPSDAAPARARARALLHACILADTQGDRETAYAVSREAYALFQQLGDMQGVASTMVVFARQAAVRGRHAEARAILEETARLWDTLGNAAAADMARNNMATVAKAEGDHDLARRVFEELLASAERRSDHRAMASALNELGDLAAARADAVLARRHHHESLAMFRRIDDQWGVARVLTDLASVDMAAEDFAAAESALAEAVQIARALGHRRGVARRLELLSWCAARRSHHRAAVRLSSAAAVIRGTVGVPADGAERQKVEATLAEAVQVLGQRAFDVAWTEGRTQTLDQVLADAAAAPS